MRKVLVIILIIVVVALIFNPKEEEIRIRVIANSNSSYDQHIKYDVVNRLKITLKETRDLDIIKADVEYVVSRYKCDHDVRVFVRKQRFPTKYIDEQIIPGGVYKTIIIEIGEASGNNYWSILYPEFFNVSFEDVNSGDVEFGWWFIDILKGE